VILVVDASGSMAATDVTPSRLAAAQAAIREFVRREPKGVRIGVVAFSGSAYVLTPPTEDRTRALGAVNYLSLGRGTNIGDALRVALETVLVPDAGEAQPAGAPRPELASLPAIANPETVNLVLLSDGASTTGPNPLEIAGAIARTGIRTYTVGLGTTQGGFIPTGSIFGGGRNMRLDERTLKGIAETTGGRYFPAKDAAQLHEVYDKLSRSYLVTREQTEVTFLPAAAGLLLLLTAGILGLVWSSKLP
jgi:Ca-activated chloride channel family protein